MPELPEVESVVQGLRARLEGRRILRVNLHQPLIVRGDVARLRRALPRSRIRGLERRGKFIIVHLEKPNPGLGRHCLIVHLGMTGQLFCCRPDLPYEKHTHITFQLDSGEHLRLRDPRRFGRVEVIPAARLEAYFAHLGAEPFEISLAEFAARLAHRKAPIKSLLLNQNLVRGLGNIYSDEALFAARIHPALPAGRLDARALGRLHRAMQRVLRAAIAAEGTSFSDYVTADGRLGRFQYRLRVYGRAGKPCPRCRQPIRRLLLAGRSSHYCPHCQPRGRRWVVQRTLRPRLRVRVG